MKENISQQEISSYGSNYSPRKLTDKLTKVASRAGAKTVYCALLLYYALIDDEVSMTDKAIVIGALGYFICPIDIIPDLLGPLGYTDDASVLLLAVKTIWNNLTPNIKSKALAKTRQWFPSYSSDDIDL